MKIFRADERPYRLRPRLMDRTPVSLPVRPVRPGAAEKTPCTGAKRSTPALLGLRGRRWRRCRRCRRRWRGTGIEPAFTDALFEIRRLGILGIDVALPHDAAEGGLDVPGRTTEPVVKVEMAKGGIEVVAPQQTDHPPSQPHAFRICGRAAQVLFGLRVFVDLLRPVLVAVGRALVGRLRVGA